MLQDLKKVLPPGELERTILHPEPTAAWIPSMLRDHMEDPGILKDIAREYVAIIRAVNNFISSTENRRKFIALMKKIRNKKQIDDNTIKYHSEIFEAVKEELGISEKVPSQRAPKPSDDNVIETLNRLWIEMLRHTIIRTAKRTRKPKDVPKSAHRICSEIVAVRNHQEIVSRALKHKDKKLEKYLELLRTTRTPYYLAKLPGDKKYDPVRGLVEKAVKLRARVLKGKDEGKALKKARQTIEDIARNAREYP